MGQGAFQKEPTLPALTDEVIDDLVSMAMARKRDAPPKVLIKELVELLRQEWQGRLEEAWRKRRSAQRKADEFFQ